MLRELFTPRFLFLGVLLLSALYTHFRGKERHGFARQLTDHSTFMAPFNGLMYFFSKVPTTSRVPVEQFPELAVLKNNWRTIRDEAQALLDAGYIKSADGYNDLAFNSFFRRGWKRFYLKWYDDYLPSARRLCPKTVALLEGIPTINAGMFTLMGPNSQLVRHRDPFGGSLRYHLGLITPNDALCRIDIDGEPYVWRDGEDIVFDATYIHRAWNETAETRLILFADVDRPLRFWPARMLNRIFVKHVVKLAQTKNADGEKVGALNHAFQWAYYARIAGKRLKASNSTLYYSVKYVLIGSLLWLVFRP